MKTSSTLIAVAVGPGMGVFCELGIGARNRGVPPRTECPFPILFLTERDGHAS